jgi:hypothetical protein
MSASDEVILKGLTKEEIKNLKEGQELLFDTGKGDTWFSAKVVVFGEIGEAGCEVKIIEILELGIRAYFDDGDTLVATFAELSVITEN